MNNAGFNEASNNKNIYAFSSILFLLAQIFFTINYYKLPSFGFIGLIKSLLLPAILIFTAVIISNRRFLNDIKWKSLGPVFSYRIMALFFPALLIIYYALNFLKVQVHIPLMMLIVVLSTAYLVMVCFEFSAGLDRAVYVFFVCFPLLNLLEYWLHINKEMFGGGIIFTPTVFFMFTLFLGLFVEINRKKIVLTGLQMAIFVCLGIFLLSGLISSILSIFPWESFCQYLLSYFYPILLLPIVFCAIDSDSKRSFFIKIIIAALVLHIIISFYLLQRFGGGFSNLISVYAASLATGFTSGVLATMILSAFPLILFAIFSSRDILSKARCFACFLFFCLILLATLSRSALASFLLGLSVLFLSERTRKWFVALILSGLIFALLFSPLLANSRYATILTGLKDSSSRAYFNAWSGAIDMLKDYPIFGIGTGMWDKYVANYVPTQHINLKIKEGVWARGYIIDPHNFYLLTFLETGLFGFMSWIGFIVLSVVLVLKNIRNSFSQIGAKYYLGISFLVFLVANASMQLTGWRLTDGLFLLGVFYWGIFGLFLRVEQISLKRSQG
ncbi:O-antigen ligase family protein [Patescibacteria group bacterium]|nr:O-antigen ligase family protein [Patescibacteria group bacterium]